MAQLKIKLNTVVPQENLKSLHFPFLTPSVLQKKKNRSPPTGIEIHQVKEN